MPSYNSSLFIRDSIVSVINQTHKDWELIIVDDGSQDNTFEVAFNLSRLDKRIQVYRQENKGVSAARNFGYKFCGNSDYVFFMDSDDIILPSFLDILLYQFDKDQEIAVVYSDYWEMDFDGNYIKTKFKFDRIVPTLFWLRKLPETNDRTPFISLFCGSNINESTAIFKRLYFDKMGGWNESLKYAEGLELFARISAKWKIIFIPDKLFGYRRHSFQSQSIIPAIEKGNQIDQAHHIVADYFKSIPQGEKIFYSARLFYETRFKIKRLNGSLKHSLRYQPIRFLKIILIIPYLYLKSMKLLLYRNYWY